MQCRERNGFYYLIQTYRENGVKNYEKYIGKTKPTSGQREEFIYQYTQFRWEKILKQIHETYSNYLEKMPDSLIVKNLRVFGVRFTHNTNKIEGSTLSLIDTHMILEENRIPTNSEVNDVIEAKSHMHLYEEIIYNMPEISLLSILGWHKTLFHLTQPSIAGQIRNGPAFISGSKYVPPSSRAEIDLLLEELFSWYKNAQNNLNPVFISGIMHYRFVSIHPFEDGNGRIARILMNYILFQNHYPMFDLDVKYRKTYYNALERADLREDKLNFISWFFPRYITYTQNLLQSYGLDK